MLHFFDEAWYTREQALALFLLGFTWHIVDELVLCEPGEEPTLWLDSEENKLDVTFDVDFNLSSVELVEVVKVFVSIIHLNLGKTLFDSFNHFAKQV